MIGRDAYEIIGTHERVREEIVEDVELGRIVKDRGLQSQVVHGEHHITAIWARNLDSLWNGLRRLMIPMYLKEKAKVCNDYLCYISHVTNAIDFIIIFNLVVSVDPLGS